MYQTKNAREKSVDNFSCFNVLTKYKKSAYHNHISWGFPESLHPWNISDLSTSFPWIRYHRTVIRQRLYDFTVRPSLLNPRQWNENNTPMTCRIRFDVVYLEIPGKYPTNNFAILIQRWNNNTYLFQWKVQIMFVLLCMQEIVIEQFKLIWQYSNTAYRSY